MKGIGRKLAARTKEDDRAAGAANAHVAYVGVKNAAHADAAVTQHS